MKRIALATYTGLPGLTDSDYVLLTLLNKSGFDASPQVWDRKRVDWKRFDMVIIRSCWDYHLVLTEFIDWLRMLEENHISVWNPVPILRWNARKTYLSDLQALGIEIIPTRFVLQNDSIDIESIVSWNEVVIKPTVGASGHNVFRFSKDDFWKAQKKVEQMQKKSDVMIQPFMKEIANGELSIVFIGGEYSHTVIKTPKSGEFRTNYPHQATETLYQLPTELLTQAKRMYQIMSKQLLYARIDAVVVEHRLVIMELECIEPHLFFDLYPPSAERFVKAVASIV